MAPKGNSAKEVVVWKKHRVPGSATRKNHTVTLVGDKVYICGGYENHLSRSRADILVLKRTRNGYSEAAFYRIHGRLPHRRNGHSAHLVGDQLFVLGGWGGSAVLVEVCAFDFVLRRWWWPKTYGLRTPRLLNMHVAEYIEWMDSIVCFGGSDGTVFEKDLYYLQVNRLVWKELKVKGTPPRERANAASCLADTSFCIFGGWCTGYQFNDVHLLTLPKNGMTPSWSSPLVHSTPPPRVGAGLAYFNGKVLLFGGKQQQSHYRDVHIYDVRAKTHKWQVVKHVNSFHMSSAPFTMKGEVPTARAGHTLTRLPQGGLLVYGGSGPDARIPGSIFTLRCKE